MEFTDAEFGPELAESFEVPISLSVSSVSTTAAKEKEKEEDEEAKNEKEKEKRRLHDTTPIVVVLHGLEATSRGTLVTKMYVLMLSYAMAISLCLCVMVIISNRGLAPIELSGAFESQCRSGLLLSYPSIYNITSI